MSLFRKLMKRSYLSGTFLLKTKKHASYWAMLRPKLPTAGRRGNTKYGKTKPRKLWRCNSVCRLEKNKIPMYLGCPTFSLQFHWYVNSWVLFHNTLALYYFFKYLYFIAVKNCITIFRVWWLNDSFIIPVYIFYKNLGRISTCFVCLPI